MLVDLHQGIAPVDGVQKRLVVNEVRQAREGECSAEIGAICVISES